MRHARRKRFVIGAVAAVNSDITDPIPEAPYRHSAAWDAGAGPFHPDENVIKGDRDSPLNKDF